MQEIASAIAEGANAFLIQFYRGNRPHRCTLRVHDFVRFPRYPIKCSPIIMVKLTIEPLQFIIAIIQTRSKNGFLHDNRLPFSLEKGRMARPFGIVPAEFRLIEWKMYRSFLSLLPTVLPLRSAPAWSGWRPSGW